MDKRKKIVILIIMPILITTISIFFLSRGKGTEEDVATIYKITLDIHGRASVLETDEKGMLKEPDEPYMPGGKFLGWYIGDERVDFSKPFTSNTTIRAKWEQE